MGKDVNMRKITVATTKGDIEETVYDINELPLYEIMMRAPTSLKRGAYYLEIPCAFDIETTNISDPSHLGMDAGDRYRQRLFTLLSSNKFHISDKLARGITDFAAIRRKYPKMLSLKYGVPVDTAYMELSEEYPEEFPFEISNPADQLDQILKVYEEIKPQDFRPFAFMYQWQFCIAGYVCFGRTWAQFRLLLRRLETEMNLSDKMRLVVYVHNLNFEFTFMKYFINITESFFRDENKPLKFLTAEGIEFRDSYALSNMNLLKFCENSGALHVKLSGDDYDYSAIRTPETPLTNDEEAYCYNDVAGLVECIQYRMQEYKLKDIPLTSTGYVRRLTRKAMNENGKNRALFKETALSPELYIMHKDAFRGGDVHGNPAYADQTVKGAASQDISSAYPAALLLPEYPIGKYHRISARRFKRCRRDDMRYIFKLRIKNPRYIGTCGNPYISYSKITALHDDEEKAEPICSLDNGRLRSYEGIIELTVLDIDYDIIRAEYAADDFFISDVYEAKKGYLPKEFRAMVISFYKQKTELKGNDEQYYYYCRIKEMINALYGMCATKIDQSEIDYDQATHSFHEVVKPLAEILKNYYKSRNNFLPYQWAPVCTALVRLKLRRAMAACGRYTLYCDTDSVKFIFNRHCMDYFDAENKRLQAEAVANGGVAYDTKGKPHYIGTWEYEGYFDEFRHLGAKRYMYIQEGKTYVTIAGVNKARAAEFFTKAGIDKFTNGTVIQDSGHLVAYYNDDEPRLIRIDGCTFETASNVALINDTYTLGMEKDYSKLIRQLKENIIAQEYT